MTPFSSQKVHRQGSMTDSPPVRFRRSVATRGTIFLEHRQDRTRPSTIEYTDDAPLATFETTQGLVRRMCRKLVVLTQF